jgi:hypothetical protein
MTGRNRLELGRVGGMKRAALVLVLLGATACTQEADVGDPACAFDETGCVPSELVLDIQTGTGGPSADLRASSPTEEWTQHGVVGTDTEMVVPSTEPGRIAPRIEISVAGDVDRAKLQVIRIGSSGQPSGFEVVRRVELRREPQIVRLENGERYVLNVRATLPGGESAFFFLTRVS